MSAKPDLAATATGGTIFLENGTAMLDFESGGFGHGGKEIIRSVFGQMRTAPLSTRHFLSQPLAKISSRLAALCPGSLEVAYLCTSGAEAVEGALKLAVGFQRKRRHFVALEGAFHGSTLGALSVCGLADIRRPFVHLPLESSFAPEPAALPEFINEQTAAVIVEPWPGGEGRPVSEAGWLQSVSRRCREVGALLIADETRTGFGRSGSILAVDQEGVIPDVLVIGGALGGGVVPVAGYVADRRVNDRVYRRRDPTLHASATGGNPVGCTAALAVIEELDEGRLLGEVKEKSKFLEEGLAALVKHHPEVALEAWGVGLAFWVRLRDVALARMIEERAWAGGLALGPPRGGKATVRVFPPLLVTPEEIREGLEILGAALTEASEEVVGVC